MANRSWRTTVQVATQGRAGGRAGGVAAGVILVKRSLGRQKPGTWLCPGLAGKGGQRAGQQVFSNPRMAFDQTRAALRRLLPDRGILASQGCRRRLHSKRLFPAVLG